MKKISEFLSENFHFLLANFSVYLNRLVFIMLQRSTPFDKDLYFCSLIKSSIRLIGYAVELDICFFYVHQSFGFHINDLLCIHILIAKIFHQDSYISAELILK